MSTSDTSPWFCPGVSAGDTRAISSQSHNSIKHTYFKQLMQAVCLTACSKVTANFESSCTPLQARCIARPWHCTDKSATSKQSVRPGISRTTPAGIQKTPGVIPRYGCQIHDEIQMTFQLSLYRQLLLHHAGNFNQALLIKQATIIACSFGQMNYLALDGCCGFVCAFEMPFKLHSWQEVSANPTEKNYGCTRDAAWA
jgi:hypothetical protein